MAKVTKTSMKRKKKHKAQVPKKGKRAKKIQIARQSADEVMSTSGSLPITPRLALFQIYEMEAMIPESVV